VPNDQRKLDSLLKAAEIESMASTFREDKATQVASRLLELAGGSLNVLPLVKLVYMVDRTSLARYGYPVTMDTFYNLRAGPVVSSTFDCIKKGTSKNTPVWSKHIAPRDGNSVTLLEAAEPTELSPADEAIIAEVFQEHGQKSVDEWMVFAHSLPEWRNPAPMRSRRFRYRDLLVSVGWSPGEADAAIGDLLAELHADRLFG
jgi:uncharacterized phage-associated protein